jgi:hypothetical protein
MAKPRQFRGCSHAGGFGPRRPCPWPLEPVLVLFFFVLGARCDVLGCYSGGSRGCLPSSLWDVWAPGRGGVTSSTSPPPRPPPRAPTLIGVAATGPRGRPPLLPRSSPRLDDVAGAVTSLPRRRRPVRRLVVRRGAAASSAGRGRRRRWAPFHRLPFSAPGVVCLDVGWEVSRRRITVRWHRLLPPFLFMGSAYEGGLRFWSGRPKGSRWLWTFIGPDVGTVWGGRVWWD